MPPSPLLPSLDPSFAVPSGVVPSLLPSVLERASSCMLPSAKEDPSRPPPSSPLDALPLPHPTKPSPAKPHAIHLVIRLVNPRDPRGAPSCRWQRPCILRGRQG